MSQDSTSTEARYYNWYDHTLTVEERTLLASEDLNLSKQERIIQRIAYAKSCINTQNRACRKILDRFPIQEYVTEDGDIVESRLMPHELDFRSHAEDEWMKKTMDKLASERVEYRHVVYFEGDPIYHEYFKATDDRDKLVANLKHYEHRLNGQIDADARKKKRPTDNKRTMT